MAIIWQDRINEFEYSIRYCQSDNFGRKWKFIKNFTDFSTASMNPNILLTPEGYLATWVGDSISGRNICFKHKNDKFDDWSIEETIEPYLTDIDIPILIPHEEDGIINLFWADFSTGKYEIQRCYTDDFGLSWHLQNKISKTKGISRDMDTANSLNKTYVIWCETSTNKKNKSKKIKFTTNDLRAPSPVVSSPNITEGEFTATKIVKFLWEASYDPSGLNGFGYILDNRPKTSVDIKTCERITDSITFYNLEDNRWYFHIASVDTLGNWSKTTHFPFSIGEELLKLMPVENKMKRREIIEVKQVVENEIFKETKVEFIVEKVQKDKNPER
ncbi:MAG: hypothetical protein KAS39_06350, partial [Actinomycetia bacterium]|nr:hypothetical protein [Actinomycetes bacterium]